MSFKYKKYKMNSQKGFTLIEMVMVVALIGILMGIVFQGARGMQQSGRDTRRIADLRRVQTHLELYFNRCGHYPNGNPCGTLGTVGTNNIISWSNLAVALGQVVDQREVPNDPLSPRIIYQYVSIDGGLSYALAATMERAGVNREVNVPLGGLACNTTLYCVTN